MLGYDGFEFLNERFPLDCLGSLEPVCTDVEESGAYSSVSEGGGFCLLRGLECYLLSEVEVEGESVSPA